MTLTVTYSDGLQEQWVKKVIPPPPPPAGLFGRIRHDYEIWRFPGRAALETLKYPNDMLDLAGQGMSRPEHNEYEKSVANGIFTANPAHGLPETVKARNSAFIPLTEDWQRFWYGLLRQSAPAMPEDDLKRAWASLTKGDRAFTNNKGWNDGYRDFINNVNPGAQPMAQECIITGGNYVKILDNGAKYLIRNVECYKVETLDGSKPPPAITRASHPWLIFFATNSTRTPVNDVEREARSFPQLGGRDVPVPFTGPGPFNYIATERIVLLPAGAGVPRPYNP